MPRGKPINGRQAEQALVMVADGRTLGDIANALGVSYNGLHRALSQTWPQEYADARERRNDRLRNEVWDLRESDDKPTARWAYDHLLRWHLPEEREAQKLEIAGQLDVSHEARLTIGSIAQALASGRIPGLGVGARGELPAAPEVLPAPDED